MRGRWITIVVAVALLAGGTAYGLAGPPLSGANVLGGPFLVVLGGVLLARLVLVSGRQARRNE